LVNYSSGNLRDDRITLYNVDISPNGYNFILSSGDGNVRMFDLRYIKKNSPDECVNIYRNINVKLKQNCESTGCQFSKDGKEIVTTLLSQHIYVFDVDKNYSKEFNLDFTSDHPMKDPKIEKIPIHQTTSLNPEQIRLASLISNVTQQNFYPPMESEEEGEEEDIEGDIDSDEYYEDEFEEMIDALFEDESEDENYVEEEEGDLEIQTYKNVYKGHYSRQTIKGVGFFGPNSEYVISGSDEGNIYIWDKKTTKLIRVLEVKN
jgi:WD40 repeat protein